MPRSRSVARFREARSKGSARSTGPAGSVQSVKPGRSSGDGVNSKSGRAEHSGRAGRTRGDRGRTAASRAPLNAALYVEGAADRAILQGWARCVSPQLERKLREVTVIMGGRRPERAQHHLAQLREHAPGARGLCVLDRDTEPASTDADAADTATASVAATDAAPATDPDTATDANIREGLEIYTWSRRHIESYLLAPAAVLRAWRGRIRDPGRLQRELAEHLPAPGDEAAFRTLDAKRLLGPQGPLALCVGKTPPLGRIARAMRRDEFHPDVESLMERLARLLNQPLPMPPVVSLRMPERR